VKPSRRDLVVRGRWARFGGRKFVCAIGRGGIVADKVEGDGGTPVGRFALTGWTVAGRPCGPS